MKYSNGATPIVCMMTNSTCYKGTTKMKIKGVLWHSTGANNPWLKRYVQPTEGQYYSSLVQLIGKIPQAMTGIIFLAMRALMLGSVN